MSTEVYAPKSAYFLYLRHIQFCADAIIQSHLLLEEDLDLFLENFEWHNPEDATQTETRMPFGVSIACFALGNFLLINYRNVTSVMISSIALASIFGYQMASDLKEKYLEQRFKKNTEHLITNFRQQYKLNINIYNYLKTRNHLGLKKNIEQYTLIPIHLKNHFVNIFNAHICAIELFMQQIYKISQILRPGAVYPEEWSIHELNLNEFTTYEECFTTFKKLKDIDILIISKLLGSIALYLCPKLWQSHNTKVLETLFYEIIPKSERASSKCLQETKENFHRLQFSVQKVQSLRNAQSNDLRITSTASKLEQPLNKFLTNLQITFEMAERLQCCLLKCIEGRDALSDSSEYVIDLNEQLAACNASFDSFSKIYGILIKRTIEKLKKADMHQVRKNENVDENHVSSTTINCDDDVEQPEDEEYDIYIGASDEEVALFDEEPEETVSTAYLSAMLEELRGVLEERRIQKGGRQGKNIENQNKSVPIENELKASSTIQQVDNHATVKVEKQPEHCPPLLPPPMPKFNLSKIENDLPEEDFYKTMNTFLAQAVKHAASQRTMAEEVFGDGSDDENTFEDG